MPDPFWQGFNIGIFVLLLVEGVLLTAYYFGKHQARLERNNAQADASAKQEHQ